MIVENQVYKCHFFLLSQQGPQQIHGQMTLQQQQQQQQLGDRTGSVPGQSGVGMGQNQPGMNVLPDQQRQQQLIGGGVGDPFSVLAIVY